MRNWMVVVVAAVALAETSASLADLWPVQDRQTESATPARASAPAKSSAAAKSVAAKPSAAEQVIFDSANRERVAQKLAPLKWDSRLAAAARTHAQKMAQAGTLSHQFPGEEDMGTRIRMAGVRFTSAAENVAQGPSSTAIHQQWMNSPAHRDNILDAELNSLGVAVVERQGELFAVQDFALVTP